MLNTTEQFRDAIQSAGMTPPDTIEPGRFYRFNGEGKSGSNKAGWCKLFADGMGGIYGDYSSSLSASWQAKRETPYTSEERDAFKRHVAEAKAEAEAERKTREAAAASKASAIWASATPCPEDHAYLVRKGIKPHGSRLHNGSLVLHIQIDGALSSLQFIEVSGGKKFLKAGRTAGGFFIIGTTEGARALCVCEGFATGASIHEATRHPVVVAFHAGNLMAVTKAMRALHPDLLIVVCGDSDASGTGQRAARDSALAVDGMVAIPEFTAEELTGSGPPSDWNDYLHLPGRENLARAITDAFVDPAAESAGEIPPTRKSEVTEVTRVQPSNGAGLRVTCSGVIEVTEVTSEAVSAVPALTERPCFRVFNDWLEHGGTKYRPGVWHFGVKEGTPVQSWICAPLHIEAVTHDPQDNHFGRLLRFKTTTGRWREWAMPMELLAGDCAALRGELMGMGLEIDPTPKARNLLASSLQDSPPKRRMRCAQQTGWCGGSFVLPDAVIGPDASGVIFQSGERGHDEHTVAGTLEGWQTQIAALAVGNPLLMLALSASFAGPLLARCNAESGGVHFVGDSSTGKTTALEAASATWGGPTYRRSWRATANGMEGAAALFNDCLLVLDEISECDPREVGAIIYALGNGAGKQRASRSGAARSVTRWRCSVLSSGERSIGTAMQEGGQRAKAGQAVRLLDVPAARRFGAWDDLHGFPDGPAFSDALKRAAADHHGHAGRAFLERLTRDQSDFSPLLERIKGLPEFSGGEGQDRRAASRFGVLALAGELATDYGLTGWPKGAAVQAAAQGFEAWRSMRGKGNGERRQILERVSAFIERHGDGRFSDANADADAVVRDRAGWWQDIDDGREYLFNPEALREALKGFDFKRALDVLQEAGALPAADAEGKRTRVGRFGGGRRLARLYPILAEKLEVDDGA